MRLAPAVGAGEVAGVDVRRHLHAARTLDAVERPLVAMAIVAQVFLGPMTDLDAAVFADQMVALFRQLGRDGRLNFGDGTGLHRGTS